MLRRFLPSPKVTKCLLGNSTLEAIRRGFLRFRCSRTYVRCAPVLESHAT
jgi:hypothetical protein